jgi:hypothetical protein
LSNNLVTTNTNLTTTNANVTSLGNRWLQTSSNVFIGSGSNIGIGISTPLYPLHVVGSTSTANIYTNGDIAAFSDARYKTNIKVIDNALEKVRSIGGYTYDRIEDKGGRRHAGVLAQEVQKILPEVIYEDKEGTLSVAYDNIIALLIEAIHDLDAKLTSLTSAK